MLLPSPDQAMRVPAIGPRCSSKVITSAISWQGWVRSVRPLMTGTVACSASSSSFSSLVVRIMMHVDIARQHARGVGDGLAAAELRAVALQHDRIAAELAHADLEGDAGAGRRLLEDHRQRLAGERLAVAVRAPCRACSASPAVDDARAASAGRAGRDRGNAAARSWRARLRPWLGAFAAGGATWSRMATASSTCASLDDQRRQQAHHIVAGADTVSRPRLAQPVHACRCSARRISGPSIRPLPRTSSKTVGMPPTSVVELRVADAAPMLLTRGRGSRRPASRRAPHCRPPWRADCRRRSSRACPA